MDHSRLRRSFKHLAVFLLVFGSVIGGANTMARAPDLFAAGSDPNAKTLTTRPACGNTAIERCLAPVKSRHAIDLAAPRSRMAVPEGTVATVEIGAFPDLPIALRLQRNLFARGGRLLPLDVLTIAAAVTRPIERTAKAPGWAMQLRFARGQIENEKERG